MMFSTEKPKNVFHGSAFADFLKYMYCILSNSAALCNSTASIIIPPDFFAFKTYSRLSNSPALRV